MNPKVVGRDRPPILKEEKGWEEISYSVPSAAGAGPGSAVVDPKVAVRKRDQKLVVLPVPVPSPEVDPKPALVTKAKA